jgi:hypothetical protein
MIYHRVTLPLATARLNQLQHQPHQPTYPA